MTLWGPDPIEDEIQRVLSRLETGGIGADDIESKHVDLKEEAGRRNGPILGPSSPHNEKAAKSLAEDAACMANTDGGGALIVGVADDGNLQGTLLHAEWLRRRIYELTQKQLTVSVREVTFIGQFRLLILRCPEAVQPIRVNQKITWRVNAACVEVDASTWQDRRMRRIGYDWSAQASGLSASQVRAAAVDRARDFLRASGETKAQELADASDSELLTRLNVVTADGHLSNAGAIAFVGRQDPALDYIRREHSGGDSLNRLRQSNRGLVEELYDIEQAIRASNPIRHLPDGLVTGQVRQLPDGAVRETIVNGCVHRDWNQTEPTLVEHDGPTLVVTSPGGFVGGVTPANIITHPSEPRNRALAELFASLRVAEREGIGVDRMVRDMIRVGHAPPEIEEIDGPRVRAALVGNIIDDGWIGFLLKITPRVGSDLNALLLLRHLIGHWWVDASIAAPLLQRTRLEAQAAISSLAAKTINGKPLLQDVQGIPDDGPQAWHLTSAALTVLAEQDERSGYRRRPVTRAQIALAWARARGRISTTELASIVGASASNVGSVLKSLEQQELLVPSRPERAGPGFFYAPVSK